MTEAVESDVKTHFFLFQPIIFDLRFFAALQGDNGFGVEEGYALEF